MHLTLADLDWETEPTRPSPPIAPTTARGWSMNKLYDGIDTLLTDLHAAGVRLAVATSKAEPTARRSSNTSAWTSTSEVIAGASLDGRRSTKSEVMAHALTQL